MDAGGGAMAAVQPWTPPYCAVVAVDSSAFFYRACATCERPLPDHTTDPCPICAQKTFSLGSKRLYRLLLSVATAEQVVVAVCFDRAARVLLGCSADEFWELCRAHPPAAERAGELLRGEMLRVTLKRSSKGNAEHLRAVSVVPLRSGFLPVIHTLREIYHGVPNHS